MSIKLFLLGRPGSGKSTAFHRIEKYLEKHYKNWSVIRYNDYDILQAMFLREKLFPPKNPKKKQFEAKELGGFDAVDFSVLDTALIYLEKAVRARYSTKKDEIIIIEFARQDYNQALSLFSPAFLKGSYFLFLDTDVKTSVQRVKDRVTDPPTPDNHFVSENILTGYYGKQFIPSVIKTKSGETVDKSRVKMISNKGTLHSFYLKVEGYVQDVIDNSSSITDQDLAIQAKQRAFFAKLQKYLPFNRKKAVHLKVQTPKSRTQLHNRHKTYKGKKRVTTSPASHS